MNTTTTIADPEELMRRYDAASLVYQDAVANHLPTKAKDQAEQDLIAAAVALSEAEKKPVRHPVWGTTGGPDYPKHGYATTYQSKKCRCPDCREAWRVYFVEFCEKKAALGDYRHGASAYSNYGCRCDVCTEAHHEYLKKLRLSRSSQAYLEQMRANGETTV